MRKVSIVHYVRLSHGNTAMIIGVTNGFLAFSLMEAFSGFSIIDKHIAARRIQKLTGINIRKKFRRIDELRVTVK